MYIWQNKLFLPNLLYITECLAFFSSPIRMLPSLGEDGWGHKKTAATLAGGCCKKQLKP